MTECKFRVGDIVRVVDSPVDCAFMWDPEMNRFCGRETEIVRIVWEETIDDWAIFLDVDSARFVWDENCIIQVENEVDVDPISDDDLLDFM